MLAAAPMAGAQVVGLEALLRSTPSDPRAIFHDGNGVGFPDSDQLGAAKNHAASDGNVTGTPAPNNGPVHPGQGEELNVTVINPNVVIDAIVVKGGNGYNQYPNPTAPPPVLPPALPPPQHYISPFNGGTNVPALSHWFVCYHLTTPPAVGSLIVSKSVIPPNFPSDSLPTTFTVTVDCDDGTNVAVTFGEGGGSGSTVTGIAPGSVCTVVEDTGGFPANSTVTYIPAGADTTGVTIPPDAGVKVRVTNDFSSLAPQAGNLRLAKAVLAGSSGVTMPASYSARVVCDDGTDATVTLPGSGGDGTPLLSPAAGALCAVGEDNAAFPAGWILTYSVDGGPASSSPPVFNVGAGQTVAVTITNDATAVAAATTTPTTPEPTTPAPTAEPVTMPETLPPTGNDPTLPVGLAILLVTAGIGAVIYTTRHRQRSTGG
jgi:Domain of unknown function (DUF5979)